MIIFDLDGTLADCEHRRHFVDPSKNTNYIKSHWYSQGDLHHQYIHKDTKEKFKPNWPAFYEGCDEDEPIEPLTKLLFYLFEMNEIEIWTGRCESVRDKTIAWLEEHTIFSYGPELDIPVLKMRPIGDNTPDEVLKERWYDLHNIENPRKNIDFVFDSDPKSIAMWRRRGIFVFDCNQTGVEF